MYLWDHCDYFVVFLSNSHNDFLAFSSITLRQSPLKFFISFMNFNWTHSTQYSRAASTSAISFDVKRSSDGTLAMKLTTRNEEYGSWDHLL